MVFLDWAQFAATRYKELKKTIFVLKSISHLWYGNENLFLMKYVCMTGSNVILGFYQYLAPNLSGIWYTKETNIQQANFSKELAA